MLICWESVHPRFSGPGKGAEPPPNHWNNSCVRPFLERTLRIADNVKFFVERHHLTQNICLGKKWRDEVKLEELFLILKLSNPGPVSGNQSFKCASRHSLFWFYCVICKYFFYSCKQ